MVSLDSLAQDVTEKLHITATEDADEAERITPDYPLYTVNQRYVHINDLTIHTVRTAWTLLVHSLPYKFDDYLDDGGKYPDINVMVRYVKYSSLVYMYSLAVGVSLCDVVKYEWPPSTKKAFGKGTGRPKPEPYALVIAALVVLPSYRGIDLSKKLFDKTVKRANGARIYKIFAITSPLCEEFYRNLGFVPCTTSPMKLEEYKVKDESGNACDLSTMEYTILATGPS